MVKLKILFYRKGRFKCVNCNDWHKNCDLMRCVNNDQHQFGAQCAFYWTDSCKHSFCHGCVIPYIAKLVNKDVIPTCLVKKCDEELDALAMDHFEELNVYHLKHKLSILIDRKFKSQCFICHKWEFNELLAFWSKCRHPYHRQCGREHINSTLLSEKSVFNAFKKESIPICVHQNCGNLLSVVHLQQFGLTKHQFQTFDYLIKKSKKSDDCLIM